MANSNRHSCFTADASSKRSANELCCCDTSPKNDSSLSPSNQSIANSFHSRRERSFSLGIFFRLEWLVPVWNFDWIQGWEPGSQRRSGSRILLSKMKLAKEACATTLFQHSLAENLHTLYPLWSRKISEPNLHARFHQLVSDVSFSSLSSGYRLA